MAGCAVSSADRPARPHVGLDRGAPTSSAVAGPPRCWFVRRCTEVTRGCRRLHAAEAQPSLFLRINPDYDYYDYDYYDYDYDYDYDYYYVVAWWASIDLFQAEAPGWGRWW